MRIAYDVTPLSHPRTGVGNYILGALEAEGTPWAEETRATLGRMSPTSLKVTLHQLRLCRGRPYDEVVTVEYRLSQHVTALPDFREGIRAVLVDKDNRPKWNPPTLAETVTRLVCFFPMATQFLASSAMPRVSSSVSVGRPMRK